ncbi:MAG: AbrB/MazE/SpoVT family DNA-binding domain-containing protein [Ruminococcus sp.]|uniref:AbrB/MazE/SpoVT family DNA-binding domain-containing protein n=1 Tax=Ruminococcus sp. TaxID=41978 RepID=UPI0037C816A3|nr:AbrB/MazE/SpoVT family DNA-binding domain-containing protein [Ruminococcus sp.]
MSCKPDYIIKVDPLHRFVIPVNVRQKLNIQSGDKLEVFCDDNKIILQPRSTRCIICGLNNPIITYVNDQPICCDCYKQIIS